jgi:hypothetical protein
MDTTHILPCPHCAGTACIHANYSYKIRRYFVFVKCDICGAQGKIFTSEEEPAAEDWNNAACIDAVNAWNMRKAPA